METKLYYIDLYSHLLEDGCGFFVTRRPALHRSPVFIIRRLWLHPHIHRVFLQKFWTPPLCCCAIPSRYLLDAGGIPQFWPRYTKYLETSVKRQQCCLSTLGPVGSKGTLPPPFSSLWCMAAWGNLFFFGFLKPVSVPISAGDNCEDYLFKGLLLIIEKQRWAKILKTVQ